MLLSADILLIKWNVQIYHCVWAKILILIFEFMQIIEEKENA